MSGFTLKDLSRTSQLESYHNTPIVSDSPPDLKYRVIRKSDKYWVYSIDYKCSIPYHSKASSYEKSEENDPDYYHYWHGEFHAFSEWVEVYSNKKRKEIKRMFDLADGQLVNPQVNDTGWVNVGPNTVARSVSLHAGIQKIAKTAPPALSTMETTMNTEYYVERSQREFLDHELTKAYNIHNADLRKRFFMDVEEPEDGEELVARIKEGKFKLKDKNERSRYDGAWSHILWRTGDKDTKGYLEAEKKLAASYAHARQDVKVDDMVKAKKAVRDFEKETFH